MRKNSFNWSELKTNPGRKALIIGMGLALLNPLSGVSALLCYSSTVFEEAGSNLSPNSSAMVVGTILFIGSLIATNLIDRAGRKVIYSVLQNILYNNVYNFCVLISFYMQFQHLERRLVSQYWRHT